MNPIPVPVVKHRRAKGALFVPVSMLLSVTLGSIWGHAHDDASPQRRERIRRLRQEATQQPQERGLADLQGLPVLIKGSLVNRMPVISRPAGAKESASGPVETGSSPALLEDRTREAKE